MKTIITVPIGRVFKEVSYRGCYPTLVREKQRIDIVQADGDVVVDQWGFPEVRNVIFVPHGGEE